MTADYDVVVIGGGHNGLTAAAYLARAGRSVLVVERDEQLGGAARSAHVFPGYDARLSKYSYLVSLLPSLIVDELDLGIELRRRRISSYTPVGDGGILIDDADPAATAASLGRDADAWGDFYAMTQRVAEAVFPTLTEPLLTREQLRDRVGPDAWQALFEEPIGDTVGRWFRDDVVRGIVLTDALIGTFASVHASDLLANRCFLYHVIGGGSGDWDVPVGGMGAVSGALARVAAAHGAELVIGTAVTNVRPGEAGERATVELADGRTVRAGHVVANVAPAVLDRLLGRGPAGPAPEGAQLKINMLLSRLPRLRDPSVDPALAFSCTFHINESAAQLEQAYHEAANGTIPTLPPCEIYCHSLTDPSILGPELQAAGAQTLTLFGLHMPARLFRDDPAGALERARTATLASLNSVLAEPIEDCLLTPDCIEVMGPLEIEAALAMPGGHIFHRDLQWPFAEDDDDAGRWGVETEHPDVLVCGAGARRGGGVSGIPGRNAAMAVLSC